MIAVRTQVVGLREGLASMTPGMLRYEYFKKGGTKKNPNTSRYFTAVAEIVEKTLKPSQFCEQNKPEK